MFSNLSNFFNLFNFLKLTMRWVRPTWLMLTLGVLAMCFFSLAIATPIITTNSTRPLQIQVVQTPSKMDLTKNKKDPVADINSQSIEKSQSPEVNSINEKNETKTMDFNDYLQQHPINLEQEKQAAQEAKQHAQAQLQTLQSMNASALEANIQNPKTIPLPIYPLQSKKLSVGSVEKQTVNLSLSKPIFLVGCDSISEAWLKQHEIQLKQLHAMGFIVNAPSQEAVTTLQKTVLMLPLIPMQGDALADWLHIQHYPVLISAHSIEQ